MATAEVITANDLAAYPGVSMPADETVTALLLELTNGLVREVIGDRPVTITAKSVALEVAARALRFAPGATSITTGIDDWKKTIRYESARAGLYLTDQDKTDLLGTFLRPSRVGSIRLRVPDYGAYSD